jgi:hypothetical protein
MTRTRWTLTVVGALLALGCQKIVEELPSRPTIVASNQPIPVVVVVVPVPVPSAPPTEPDPPRPQPPNPNPNPGPTPNPAPTRAPNPQPPAPGGNGIVRVGAKVFFVECGGVPILGSEHASEVELGCRVHMDCQGKNAANEPVNPRNTPSWTFDPADLVRANNLTDFTPTLQTRGRGRVCGSATMDGVRSNDVCFNIR